MQTFYFCGPLHTNPKYIVHLQNEMISNDVCVMNNAVHIKKIHYFRNTRDEIDNNERPRRQRRSCSTASCTEKVTVNL